MTRLVTALQGAEDRIEVAAPRTPDGRIHPFPSAWRVQAAPRLVALVEGGARRADAGMGADVLVAVPAEADELEDLDTPEDVARWASAAGVRPPS